MNRVNILGEEYEIITRSEKEDLHLEDNYSYCDPTIKKIIIATMRDLASSEDSLADINEFRNHCIRHEIIHAMLYESGLYTNCDYAMNEELIDWISLQFHKLRNIFDEVEA